MRSIAYCDVVEIRVGAVEWCMPGRHAVSLLPASPQASDARGGIW